MEKITKALAFILIILGIAYVISSCSVTKSKQTDSSSIETHDAIDVDSLVKVKLDSTVKYYEAELKRATQSLEFGENCNDDSLNAIIFRLNNTIKRIAVSYNDSLKVLDELRSAAADLGKLKKEPGKLVFKNDGSFEATNLKTANLQWLELTQRIFEATKQMNEERQLKIKAQNDLKAVQETITKNKKTGFPWLIAIISYVLGIATIILLGVWVAKHSEDDDPIDKIRLQHNKV